MTADWWQPKKLKAEQKIFQEINIIEKLDVRSDFGSYKRILLGDTIEGSMIRTHNDIYPRSKVKIIKEILEINYEVKKVLDAGCGIGYTTRELKLAFPNAEIVGIDISEDAIKFAKYNFPDCKFYAESIEPLMKDYNDIYDLIFSFEFYPFTRTCDFDVHKSYISHFISRLTDSGKLIICQLWDNSNSLSVNMERLIEDYPKYRFEISDFPIRKVITVFRRYRVSLVFSNLIRIFFRIVFNKKLSRSKILIVSKK